ncbi:MAG: hypothetical protein IPL25_15850 [Saprospiraceae bacterium]|nr:hypothetical protein [Candidatus Vicinibacter affinis]
MQLLIRCAPPPDQVFNRKIQFQNREAALWGGAVGSKPLDTAENTLRMLKILNPEIATANIGKWHLQQAMPVSNLKFQTSWVMIVLKTLYRTIVKFTNWTKYINGGATNVTNYATSENVNNAVTWLKIKITNHSFVARI